MGCCSSKKDKLNNSNKNKTARIEEINIESQEKELINILTEVNRKIDDLKNEVNYITFIYNIQALTNEIYSGSIENEYRLLQLKKRCCYLSQLQIFVKWVIKVQNVNQKDERFDDIIQSLWEIVDLNDSFLITSIENKIKYILNKKQQEINHS